MSIVDHRGEPLRRAELTREIAAPQAVGVRQVWHPSAADDLTPAKLTHILQQAKRGNGQAYLTLAEEMEERDMHYASVLGTRKLAVSGLEVRVDALSDEARDIEIADAVRELVDAPAFDALRFDLMDALGKGYSVAEILWQRSGQRWTPQNYVWRDPRFFVFDRVTHSGLRLRDAGDMQDGLPLPAYKFVAHSPRLRSGVPLRGGLAYLCAVGYMCKAWTWRDWMAFADIFGIPMRIGRHNNNASAKDVETLVAAVLGIGTDGAAVIPDSMRVELMAAPNTAGAADFFERLATFWDKQVSKAVLGQTMTADDGASLSQAQVHNEVRLDLLKADATALQTTLNRDLVRPFVDLNFGGGRYPHLVVVVPEPEDTRLLVDALTALVPLGLRVEQSVIRDKLGLPEPAEGKDVELLRPVQDHFPDAAKMVDAQAKNRALNRVAPAREPDYLAVVAEQVATQTAPLTDAWMETVHAVLQEAGSFEEALMQLADLQTRLSIDELGQVLSDAFAATHRAGMSDAEDDAHG